MTFLVTLFSLICGFVSFFAPSLHRLLLSSGLALHPLSQVLSLSPHPLQSLLMATCLSIIDILTGLTSRPHAAPLSSSMPYFAGALMRHTHPQTHKLAHVSVCETKVVITLSVY